MTPICYLDFEYNGTSEKKLNLVSCAWKTNNGRSGISWLHNSSYSSLFEELEGLVQEGYTFMAYAVTAEARAMLSMGMDVVKIPYIDLYLEYRCLTNHNHKLAYGRQLQKGEKKVTYPPSAYKYKLTEEEDREESNSKPEHNLAAACYKLLGVEIDTEHKTKMRDIIISNVSKDIEENKEAILKYNISDIDYLPRLFKAMIKEYGKLLGSEYGTKKIGKEMRVRGNYAARTAVMESLGYPINVQETRAFSDSVYGIIRQVQTEINTLFPDVLPFTLQSSYDYSWSHVRTREWISGLNKPKWIKTKGGADSLSLKAFKKYFPYQHDYPTDCLGAQLVRYLTLKQNLNGFTQSQAAKKKKDFWDAVGVDGRVRPYFGIYGAQSARSQPSATQFLFLKSAWMRVMCQPPKGRAICAIDYKSQEFLLAGLMSNDSDMIKAYESGDVYLYFAKLAGAVPWEGTREEYGKERDLFKEVVLALSYGMGYVSLRETLTVKVGRKFSDREAQDFITMFEESFSVYHRWKERQQFLYRKNKHVRLPCLTACSEVYTDSGFKKIIDVTVNDLLWDGLEWVKHGGVVAKGKKGVINLKEMNIGATPDHLVLLGGWWRSALEVAVLEESQPLKLGKFSEGGQLLRQKQGLKVEGLSYVAAYVNLKNSLELMPYEQGKLSPVFDALTLLGRKSTEKKSPKDIATFLMTSIFSEGGELLTTTPSLAAKMKITNNGKIMGVEVFNSPSNPLESSWNTLLHLMGVTNGALHSTGLIMMETMKLETYELLAHQKTTKTKEEVYDIINCGPRKRFQVGRAIAHNCGWFMFGDNQNKKSVGNVPVQGFGSSIMRKAVCLAQDAGLEVILTLHDALYIEYDDDDMEAITTLAKCMDEAFRFYFDKETRKRANVGLDANIWGPGYVDGYTEELPLVGRAKRQTIYVDARSVKQYEAFKGYFKEEAIEI